MKLTFTDNFKTTFMTQFVYCSRRHTGLKHEVACCIFGCFELHYCAGTKSWNIALQYKPNPSVMKLQAMTASRTTIWTRRPRQPTSPGPHTLALKWQRCTHPNLALYLTLSSFYPKIYLLLQKKTQKQQLTAALACDRVIPETKFHLQSLSISLAKTSTSFLYSQNLHRFQTFP